MEIQNALDGTHYFCNIRYKAIYWYLIEMLAVRLKTGELRNPEIYEFNPGVLYDPKRNKSNKTLPNHRAETIPATGIPPPGKKTSPNCRTISDENRPLISSDQKRLPRPSYAPTSSSPRRKRLFVRLNLRRQ